MQKSSALRPPDFTPFVIPFNLRDVLAKKVEAPSLEPFDTVRIFGRYETAGPKVSIFGEVMRPGEYPLSERMTAADLLRMAGGFKISAYQQAADLTSYSVIDGDHVDLDHRDSSHRTRLGWRSRYRCSAEAGRCSYYPANRRLERYRRRRLSQR